MQLLREVWCKGKEVHLSIFSRVSSATSRDLGLGVSDRLSDAIVLRFEGASRYAEPDIRLL